MEKGFANIALLSCSWRRGYGKEHIRIVIPDYEVNSHFRLKLQDTDMSSVSSMPVRTSMWKKTSSLSRFQKAGHILSDLPATDPLDQSFRSGVAAVQALEVVNSEPQIFSFVQ
jgi:hypothetical protein